MSETRKKITNSQCKDIVYNVSKYFEEQASDPSTTPVNAYIQKTVDATSITERSIRRIRTEQSDTEVLLSPPKTRNREPRKPVDDFDRCAIRNKIHEFYTVRRQLPTIAKLHESLKMTLNLMEVFHYCATVASNGNVPKFVGKLLLNDMAS